MSWARQVIEDLSNGNTVQFRPSGNSMAGKINHRDLVTVSPVSRPDIKVGDIVLCKVGGRVYLHLVKAIDRPHGDYRFKIGNNHGHVNGWTTIIYGRCISINNVPTL